MLSWQSLDILKSVKILYKGNNFIQRCISQGFILDQLQR
jgi:hypothetical protein